VQGVMNHNEDTAWWQSVGLQNKLVMKSPPALIFNYNIEKIYSISHSEVDEWTGDKC
jgi:hypothetical protein